MSTLLDRLSQLQNLVKRDPSSYAEEFRLQAGAFAAELGILRLRLHEDNEAFRQLAMFMTHVAPSFPADCAALPPARRAPFVNLPHFLQPAADPAPALLAGRASCDGR